MFEASRVVLLAGCTLFWALAPRFVVAEPWVMPGDATLRHDLTVLADAGLLRTPITTWPVSWPDVARDVAGATASGRYAPQVEQALSRVSRAARAAAATGYAGIDLAVGIAESPDSLRGFSGTQRERAEVTVGGRWLGERFAASLRVTRVSEAQDGRSTRLDGSYVGLTAGNFMISFGAMDRWWGPGWDGSLILSSNARPLPGITVERNYTDASKLPVLRWLGPWRASLAIGEADGSDVAVREVRFLAARLNFRPRPWFEFGLSRTAQWCGEGRPCDGSTFVDLLAGRDNRSSSLSASDEPGNQMAGYDLRVRMPWIRASTALFAQAIGEDESGGLPSKFLGLLGVEVSDGGARGAWRARLEFADTSCVFTRSTPEFNCAYRNSLYPQGYTHRGRIIGHSLDGDGQMLTGAFVFVRPGGTAYGVKVRDVRLNRDGAPDPTHTVSSDGRADRLELEVNVDSDFLDGRVMAGVGYAEYSRGRGPDSGVRWFARYSRGL